MVDGTRVLIIDDSENDALLLARALRSPAGALVTERVDDAATMRAALAASAWDVILCDWSMPTFDALEALEILRETGLDIPFLIVSGSIAEETAVDSMRAGAHDYVLKDRLARLAPAVDRELRAAREREEHRRAELAYREKLRRLAFDASLEEEDERRRLGAELRDRVGQPLVLARQRLTELSRGLPQAAQASVAEVLAVLAQTLADARALTLELRPPVLDDDGLKAPVAWAAAQLGVEHGLAIEVEGDDGAGLDDGVAQVLVRLVRELLRNVARHSGSLAARVVLERADAWLSLDVVDEGVGFDASAMGLRASAGLGLFSAREQLTRLGGTLVIESSPASGTRVSLRVPLAAVLPP